MRYAILLIKKEKYGAGAPWIVLQKNYRWFIGDRSAKTFEAFYRKKLSILKKAVFYVDGWEAYRKILPKDRIIVGKKHTIGIEQSNSNIRHYLSRFNPKIVSHSIEMIALSLRLCCYLNEYGGFQKLQKMVSSIFS